MGYVFSLKLCALCALSPHYSARKIPAVGFTHLFPESLESLSLFPLPVFLFCGLGYSIPMFVSFYCFLSKSAMKTSGGEELTLLPSHSGAVKATRFE